MSFDWIGYLQLAEELVDQAVDATGQEAKLRTAISRAYYAAFGKARDYLRQKGASSEPPAGIHSYVQRQFRANKYKVSQQIAWNLNQLQIRREKADYEPQVINLIAETRFSLTLAQRIISDLNQLTAVNPSPD